MGPEVTRDLLELVLVVPAATAALAEGYYPPGLAGVALPQFAEWEKAAHFMERSAAEANETWRQILPYVVVLSEGKFLTYMRDDAMSEVRLQGRCSIGWGGHVQDIDATWTDQRLDLSSTLVNARSRELAEELPNLSLYRISGFGIVCDNTTPVGRVHLGIVEVLNADSCCAGTGGEGSVWLSSLDHLVDMIDQLEPWSHLIVRHYAKNGLPEVDGSDGARICYPDADRQGVPAERYCK